MDISKPLYRIVVAALVLSFLFSVYAILVDFVDRVETRKELTSLVEDYISKKESLPVVLPSVEETSDESIDSDGLQHTEDKTCIKVDWSALAAVNEDIIGWLSISESSINYPVVQGEDNNEYLSTSFHGRKSKYGSIFMDFRNTADADNFIVMYGHNMGNSEKEMFSELQAIANSSDLERFSVKFYEPERTREFRIFATRMVTLNSTETVNEVYCFNENSDEYYENIIGRILSHADRTTDIETGGQVLILSTCKKPGNKYDRVIVYCVEVVTGEAVRSE